MTTSTFTSPPSTLTCDVCGPEQGPKPVTAFERTPGGFRKTCKPCRAAKRKDSQAKRADKRAPEDVPKPEACARCGKGNDEVEFLWRTDGQGAWRTVCTTCYNEKGYHKVYRGRKLAEDAEGYRAHNTAVHAEWVRRNPEKVKEQQRLMATDPDRKIKQIRSDAKAGDIAFEEADVDAMKAKLPMACHYCAYTPGEGEPLNALDRVDNALGFTDTNTVPCCATCNAMKNVMHLDEFVVAARRIASHMGVDMGEGRTHSTGAPRERLSAFAGRAELRAAPKKEKLDLLTDDVKLALWCAPCYLCGKGPALGIDRESADGDYTVDNSRPCCTTCNFMKKNLALDDFQRHVRYINEHTREWAGLEDTALDRELPKFGGFVRQPVAAVEAHTDAVLLVFPSIGAAGKVLAVAHTVITRALDVHGATAVGCGWRTVSPRAYREYCASAEAALSAIKRLRISRKM